MKQPFSRQQHTRGAIAILFALSLVVLFAALGIALDLGRLYVVRTEFQNAADAAALAGAKDLNQQLDGINTAIATANAVAGQNRTTFSLNGNTGITIPSGNIWVGTCPSDACMTPVSSVTSDALAAGKTFLKVNIPSASLTSYFMRMVPALTGSTTNTDTSTYGLAVAGRFMNEVTPIGICAVEPTTKGGIIAATGELTEFGFRRGLAYNVFDLGPVAGSGNPYLLDPIGPHSQPCVPSNSSAKNTLPFVCSGNSSTITTAPTLVWGNSGLTAVISKALNVRFDQSPPPQCVAALSPPDVNVQDYPCIGSSCPLPEKWMGPPRPIIQSLKISIGSPPPTFTGARPVSDYGVLWSYSRAVHAQGTSPNATAGAGFSPTDWPTLYPVSAAPFWPAAPSYPGSGITSSPYAQPSGSPYFKAPVFAGTANRRVLNLAIINCNIAPLGTGACQTIPVVGIGKFFMQSLADISARQLVGEFAGLIDPIPDSVIRLYR